MESCYTQANFGIAVDWGPQFAAVTRAKVVVVVDVLSFSTSVTVAVSRNMAVFPFAWKDDRAVVFAEQVGAALAVGRLEASQSGGNYPSLSPALLQTCPHHPRIVLPSPNGSQICAALQRTGAEVVIGCLRNADAVSEYLCGLLGDNQSVAFVAAGERWRTDDSLRPALEDYLGVGAILSRLDPKFRGLFSPEAHLAAATYNSLQSRTQSLIKESASGMELFARGFGDDVAVAVDVAVSDVVPVLSPEGAFRSALDVADR